MEYIECLFIDESVTGTVSGPMPGVPRSDPAAAVEHVARRCELGITGFLVFGVPAQKGLERAATIDSVVPRFLSLARERFGGIVTFIADIGLSPYSVDGHSVVMTGSGIDIAGSYRAAGELAVAFATAGADLVAPCLSLPDQVGEIREALTEASLETPIVSYSAKFSSAFYGPYRATVRSSLGPVRKDYQTDYTDSDFAIAQVHADIAQGAAMVIVKPSMLYLDVLAEVSRTAGVPVCAYQVSGEYLALLLAAEHGRMDRGDLFDEYHAAVERCGADYVIGYAGDQFLRR